MARRRVRGRGRPELNPGSERRKVLMSLDVNTVMVVDVLRTHSVLKRDLDSRSGLVERLIWEEVARVCPQYLGEFTKPRIW